MERRTLGKTGEQLSMVGFGGILVTNETPDEAARLVHKAIERGINYFDVAPTYGNAEERLGPALEPYRQDVFLACKTGKRGRDEAWAELQNSLRLLRTDHFDLYQFHAVTTAEDVEQIFAPGGAMEAFQRAQREGLTRYLGFSAHSEEAALAMMSRHAFDTILFPVNWVTWHEGKFGPAVLEMAMSQGLGILALKTLAKRAWREGEEREWAKCWYRPVESYEEAEWAVRFTFSKPVTAGPCPGHEHLFDWYCRAAEAFQPLPAEEEQQLAASAQGLEPIFSHQA